MKAYIIASTVLAAWLCSSAASAWDQDPFAMYLQHSDKVTLGAGNAKDVNAATHVIERWRRYVGNRNIPANGERMVGAITRYRCGSYKGPPAPIVPSYGQLLGVTAGQTGGGGASGGININTGSGGISTAGAAPPGC